MSGFKYDIITEIKKSDKSNVYLASVDTCDFPVIVKEIKHGDIHVFEALKEMDCEYLPKIYHVELIEDGLLVVEEYVDGELLADHLAIGKLTESECLNMANQICDALDMLHSHRPALIHRDIKPSNIIITPKGKVKLIDYDSSRLYKEESEEDTRHLGTEKYAPPEQYGFSQTDCRSDIYSLGVVFEKFTDFLSEPKQKLWKLLVEKCTLFSPDSRYQNISEVQRQLEKIRKCGWNRYKTIVMFIVIILMMSTPAAIYWISQNRNDSNTPESLVKGETTTEESSTVPTEASNGELTTAQTEDSTTDSTIAPTTEPTEAPTTRPTVASTEPPTIRPTVAPTETPTTEEPTTEQPTIEEPTTEPINMEELEIVSSKELIRTSSLAEGPAYDILDTDVPAVVSVKEYLAESNARVLYYLKSKMEKIDYIIPEEMGFLYQVRDLETEPVVLAGLKITSVKSDKTWNIPNDKYLVTDNVVVILKEYMNTLEDGIYSLSAVLSTGNGKGYAVNTYVYIYSEKDPNSEYWWPPLQEISFEYKRGSKKNINIVPAQWDNLILGFLTGEGLELADYKRWKSARVYVISGEYLESRCHLEKDTMTIQVGELFFRPEIHIRFID